MGTRASLQMTSVRGFALTRSECEDTCGRGPSQSAPLRLRTRRGSAAIGAHPRTIPAPSLDSPGLQQAGVQSGCPAIHGRGRIRHTLRISVGMITQIGVCDWSGAWVRPRASEVTPIPVRGSIGHPALITGPIQVIGRDRNARPASTQRRCLSAKRQDLPSSPVTWCSPPEFDMAGRGYTLGTCRTGLPGQPRGAWPPSGRFRSRGASECSRTTRAPAGISSRARGTRARHRGQTRAWARADLVLRRVASTSSGGAKPVMDLGVKKGW